VIPPSQNGQFVADMENILDIYRRPYNKDFPVVCMDESPRQLIKETRIPLPCRPGHPRCFDYEYIRCGVYNVFMACEPLAGKRLVLIVERKTKIDWAYFLEKISKFYNKAKKITLIMDNLNTHKAGSLYEVFPPTKAKSLWDRFEFEYTPKHGSWLNIAEIELNVLAKQCLNRRFDNISEVKSEAEAWQQDRNNKYKKVNWQFTTDDARIKLKRLYPTLEI